MGKIKVLIIEDNDDIRGSTAEILELANYEVLQATNGKEGVAIAGAFLPELILCDIMMPEMDGYSVLHLLGKKPETAVIPFIFLTAKTDRQDMRKGMEMGADDYLTKPFDDVELFNAIEIRLKKYQSHKALNSTSLDNLSNLIGGKNGLEELKKHIKERKVRHIKKKQVIYYEGDTANGLYLIVSGKVKTFKVAQDGRELLTGLYGLEEYFGTAALLAGESYMETAEAVENTSLCLIPRDLMEQLLNKYPDVSSSFIKLLANNVLQNEQQLLELAYHSVRKRMSEVILRLYNSNREALFLNVSRDNLAAMAGIATETVSRILSDFNDEGMIKRNGGKIVILDPDRLKNMKN
ncbi:response regulator [Pedobacter sp. JCM 36344]|uniref:response regulator n=1 Tax=Pedobacter sp. JCM 36344 TaxID=3374280 RepID=UPI00397CFDAA